MCRQEGEMKFLSYNPEQAYLLPPRVADVLGKSISVFFLRRVVDRLDLNSFEEAYEDEGRRRTRRSCWWRCGCTLMRWG